MLRKLVLTFAVSRLFYGNAGPQLVFAFSDFYELSIGASTSFSLVFPSTTGIKIKPQRVLHFLNVFHSTLSHLFVQSLGRGSRQKAGAAVMLPPHPCHAGCIQTPSPGTPR